MELNGQTLTLTEIATMVFGEAPVKVSSSARPRVLASRKVIEDIVGRDDIVYGVSTGFGKLSDVRIPHDALAELQFNLVRSHACGIGTPLSEPEARAMMLLRANVLALGFSGIRLEIIEALCELLNQHVCPLIPEKGSVGASGDLAPLAHLALSLIGEGEAFFQGERMESREALRRAGLKPAELQAKEGLALLNGTQAMHAVGGLALLRAKRLIRVVDVAGATSLEALKGTPAALDLKSTRLNSSHRCISYAVFCLKKKHTLDSTTIELSLHSQQTFAFLAYTHTIIHLYPYYSRDQVAAFQYSMHDEQ